MSLLSFTRSSLVRSAFVAVATIGLLASVADARPGRGNSVGSRGSNTHTAPPATNTAPSAQPMQKSMTQPGAAQAAKPGATAAAAQAAKPSMMRNLLLGGLIGAGLASIFGVGAFASVMGFLLQALLIGGLVFLAVMAFRKMFGAKTPATANAAPMQQQPDAQQMNLRQAASATGGSLPTLQLQDADFSAFEKLLVNVQQSYSNRDVNALGNFVTPEMLSYFAGELDDCKKRGVHNKLGVPTLLQGDLSEAWREAGSEYATVAMRYSLTDAVINLADGKLVAGSETKPDEVTEIWTFRRDPNAGVNGWELSAIQQTA